MRITKQTCIDAEIKVFEDYRIRIKINNSFYTLFVYCDGNKIEVIQPSEKDYNRWVNIPIQKRTAAYTLIAKSLNKKL